LLQVLSILNRNPEPFEGEDFSHARTDVVDGGGFSQSHSSRPFPRRGIGSESSGLVPTSI